MHAHMPYILPASFTQAALCIIRIILYHLLFADPIQLRLKFYGIFRSREASKLSPIVSNLMIYLLLFIDNALAIDTELKLA